MRKQFAIIVVPCKAGYGYGYVARCGSLQFWDKSRTEVIKQMLDKLMGGN